MTLKALRNELIGVFLTLIFGVITGFIVSFYSDVDWETQEMRARGTVREQSKCGWRETD